MQGFMYVRHNLGPNPTIVSYNASAVKIYNATSSHVRFENKSIVFLNVKSFILLQRWRYSCKFKSRRIGSWQNKNAMSI
jgi:hypothetical protein